MAKTTTTAAVRTALIEKREIALLDVRDEDPFAQAHPLFATSFPLGWLELQVFDRLPRKDVTIVVYDNGEGLAERAVRKLGDLGYSDVSLLDGGLQGWIAAGGEIFIDVNVPSKSFGELVESVRHTPSIPAPELRAKIDAGENIAILDARRFEEYHTMSIPTGTSVPGGELVYRVAELVPDPETLVVVNCAGRTRSIIGTQSLINAGIPNKVVALRNGTIGWTLAGLTLDHGQERRFSSIDRETKEAARASARRVAARAGVKRISHADLGHWVADRTRTLYRFDVRDPSEFIAGHLPHFRSAPGGQLVQETDVFAPVRGARIVLADDDGARADMTGSWLAQMGWDVSVLINALDGQDLVTGAWRPTRPASPDVPTISAADLSKAIKTGAVTVLEVGSAKEYALGHVPGAWFAPRAYLADAQTKVPAASDIVFTSPDGYLAGWAAADYAVSSGRTAKVLAGGFAAWVKSGGAVEKGLTHVAGPLTDAYKRPYEGTDVKAEAMQAYLDWEFGLVAQLARDGTHGFKVLE
jgi:rhodanese-related sulfurtransferase